MDNLKKYIQKIIPTPEEIKKNKSLRLFKIFFQKPNLWYFNKYSVSSAFAVGFFCAWIPLPFQMIFAAGASIIFNSNMPISISLVWITNPVTMPVLYFIAYKFGAYLLNVELTKFYFEPSFDWFISTLSDICMPFLLGCFVIGITGAIFSLLTTRLVWRFFIIKKWEKRKLKINS